MKKNLLITLADKNYIKQAKQLFSSVYFNAGWKGDYMLLAYDVPEKNLKWFREKGILIKKVYPKNFFKFKKEWVKIISSKQQNISMDILQNHLFKTWHVASCKLFLFTTYFKKWKSVIYLDGDITVRGSLDDLTKVKEFAVCLDYPRPKLIHQFVLDIKHLVYIGNNIVTIRKTRINDKLILKFKKNYNTKKPAFNSGVMAFNTDIISDKTFSRIKNLFDSYGKISFGGFYEQGLLNLLFYKKWTRLPIVYNLYAYYFPSICDIKPEKIKGIILHFTTRKPWNSKDTRDCFYKEWKYNLDRADLIDLKHPKKPKKWTKWEIKKYSLYLKNNHFLYLYKELILQYLQKLYRKIDKKIGLIGIFLKKKSPKVYCFFKK